MRGRLWPTCSISNSTLCKDWVEDSSSPAEGSALVAGGVGKRGNLDEKYLKVGRASLRFTVECLQDMLEITLGRHRLQCCFKDGTNLLR